MRAPPWQVQAQAPQLQFGHALGNAPPQQRAHARLEFAQCKRFHQVVVGAEIQRANAFLKVLARGRDDGHADVATVQARLTPVAARIVGGMGVAGVKAALDHVGLAGGAPRPPLRPLAPGGAGGS